MLNRPTPARHPKPSHGRKNKPASKRVTHPDTSSTRLALPRPQHGRVTLTLRLSAPTVSIQIRPKHRPKRRALVVRVGGTVRVLRGRATLAKTTLHLQAPITCASAAPGRHQARPSATPTAKGAQTPLGSATASTGASVTIQNFAFSPTPITVVAGSTVTWANKDGAAHTVSADDGSWGSGNLAQGATYSHTFDKPGTYRLPLRHSPLHARDRRRHTGAAGGLGDRSDGHANRNAQRNAGSRGHRRLAARSDRAGVNRGRSR